MQEACLRSSKNCNGISETQRCMIEVMGCVSGG